MKARRDPRRLTAAMALLATTWAATSCAATPMSPSPASPVAEASSAAATMGTATVALRSRADGRRLLAYADVAWVDITLEGAHHFRQENVSRAYLESGTGGVTFSGLPPGAIVIRVDAVGRHSEALGTGYGRGTIVAGETTLIDVDVYLTPDVPAPRSVGQLGAAP